MLFVCPAQYLIYLLENRTYGTYPTTTTVNGQRRHYVIILGEVESWTFGEAIILKPTDEDNPKSWIFGETIILKPTREDNSNRPQYNPDNRHVFKADYIYLCFVDPLPVLT